MGIDNILTVIPARGGSKGVPRKNVKLLGGKPLIAHTIETALAAENVDKVIVSTDDKEVHAIAEEYGVSAPFIRPQELSGDTAPLLAVVRHAIGWYAEKDEHFDAAISLQPTCPFLKPGTLDSAIELWLESGCDSVTTVAEIENGHPYIAKRILKDGTTEPFCKIPEGAIVAPRQKREKAYYLTGSLYLRSQALLACNEAGHCLGNDSRVVVVEPHEAVDINTPIDFSFAEHLIASKKASS